jgi:hypothetical protein
MAGPRSLEHLSSEETLPLPCQFSPANSSWSKGTLDFTLIKLRYYPRKNRVFGNMIFLPRVLQKTLWAGARNKAEGARRQGYGGNTDFWGSDGIGVMHGNSDYFPVEYGPKG